MGQKMILSRPMDLTTTGGRFMPPFAERHRTDIPRQTEAACSRLDVDGALLLADDAEGDAVMAYTSFNVIQRYNPSDFYALNAELIGNAAA